MTHDEFVIDIISKTDSAGRVKSRERNDLEYKQTFGQKSWPKYVKSMAAFANNRGGYILFGIQDNPRKIMGVNSAFKNFKEEDFTDYLNSFFAPELIWESGIVEHEGNTIGFIFTEEADNKPIIAQKSEGSEKINSGDIYYRYRGRSEKIKFPEMNHIIDECVTKERENMMRLFEVIRKSGTANLGIVNYGNGRFTTPYGVDVAFDRKLVTQVLKKAKFIKEGSFSEIDGTPVLKVTGNIDLAEEIPVPETDPDKQYPYIQKQLAEKLNITTQDLYALIWYYKMKDAKKYHIEVTTSQKSKTHKFSEFAFQFLNGKLTELKDDDTDFDKIRAAYRNRNN